MKIHDLWFYDSWWLYNWCDGDGDADADGGDDDDEEEEEDHDDNKNTPMIATQ